MSEETVRVGVNGFGRIGRNVFRASLDNDAIEIVGINDVMEDEEMEYLAKYDSVMGRLDGASLDDGTLTVEGTDFEAGVFHETDPTQLPWEELDVDITFESTGIFRSHEDASQHLDAGADKVVISAPPKGDTPVKQLVYGVNHDEYDGEDVVSNASCTTNSITPVAKVLQDEFGIESGQLTTVHAYTGTQNLVDGPNSKPRRRRAAAENIIPTTTGAAQAATEVLPELEGKLDGMAMRVPVPDGSITEFVCTLETDATESDINAAFEAAADGELEGVLGVSDDPIVSRDVLGQPYSTMVDLENTNVVGDLVKVLTWYDNEFGFANRMLDLAAFVAE
ncbi:MULTISPECIES: type I glyceraldehyde-3-phosphate dehydrogenase [Halomicrobium]|uniref:glyceraldehyde-3-phosphate dehydrogenase (NAD(P)(+)) (phosphorylating) n=2 Tax=Halomicrobium mukohataei TaxID=57705 RepID=C7NZA5_HALMD|nr:MULTISPECIES: type I glyceraldehyde-3-phosphate dehydrogenase [Halomicrobium]ACV46791.1 glyceraldehyde-3-phosphate dehydrogenase, type I [Halomicrobium mukohataei DSM 12286]QCD65296.1 type I glyceraldehyde-3-phosphate dehydrogenase [Halomicrobium mukohataei]QFR20102.1 type I glyceraldehyde-3-phosphate dehydrogenase [Halomicrobium sp. ZPS1]